MQVIQVEIDEEWVAADEQMVRVYAVASPQVTEFTVRREDVIELTEERVRRHTEGVGWERRLISEWEAVDGD